MMMLILIALLMWKSIRSEHIVRRSNESSLFDDMKVMDLDLSQKTKYTFLEIAEVGKPTDCLHECNYEKLCRYGYFLQSICYICNITAENYLIDRRKRTEKTVADGKLYRRVR